MFHRKQINDKYLDGKLFTIEKAATETSIFLRKRKAKLPNQPDAEDSNKKATLDESEILSKEEQQEVDLLGFSLIVEAIIKVKRPIIGHYMGLDIFYFYDHFVDHLPNTFLEFVAKVK